MAGPRLVTPDYEKSPLAALTAASVDIEQALIASVLFDNRAFEFCRDIVLPEFFTEELHRHVWTTIDSLLRAGRPASLISVKPYMPEVEIRPGLSAWQYLVSLSDRAVQPSGIKGLELVLRDVHAKRLLITAAEDFLMSAHNAPAYASPTELASNLLTELQDISAAGADLSTRHEIGASAAGVIEYAKSIKAGTIKIEAATTGYEDVDRATGGYEPGTLWVVAARPGIGKTNYMVDSALRTAHKGNGALENSLEVAERQITARHLANLSYESRRPIVFGSIMRGDIADDEIWRLEEAQQALDRLPLVVDVASRATVNEIAAKARAEKARLAKRGVPLRVVFVDYLKFLSPSDRYRGQRVYEVGEISRGLKQLAKDDGLCVVLLAQLNRALESRDDKRPTLSDLRESGDLEQDADVVAFLHRESYHLEKSAKFRANDEETINRALELKNDAELILGKNRAGPPKTINLFCDVACAKLASRSWFDRSGGH
jgi:replicative DNA helicase